MAAKRTISAGRDILLDKRCRTTLRTHPGLSTRIIEKPGATLDDAALEKLVEQLRQVVGRTLSNGALTYGAFSGERERLSQTIVTLVSETATGRAIAFNALALMEARLNGDIGSLSAVTPLLGKPYRKEDLASAARAALDRVA